MSFLRSHPSHPSVEDVYDAVKSRFPTLSLATVYNTLEALRDRGEIVEVIENAAKKRFDTVVRRHHHLICVGCKKILDIPEKWKPVLSEHDKRGFQIIRSQVDFHGLCPQCQKRNRGQKN